MPQILDRQPIKLDRQSMSSTDRMKELVDRVFTNRDGLTDTELLAELRTLARDGVTQVEIVQIIEDFPPKQVSINGKKWFLDMVNRAYAMNAGQAPMKT